MIDHLRKNKISYLLGLLLVLAFFVSRIVSLTKIPIFTDEAIYLRWSQVMAYDASLRYLPLVDGKQPLYMWLVSIAIRLLHSVDILFVGRLVAIFSGAFSMIGLFFSAKWLFGRKDLGLLAMTLYLVSPFTFMYDRLALADSLLAAFATWSFALSVVLIQRINLEAALLLGGSIGLGLLTKTPALFSLINLPLFLFLFDWKAKNRFSRLLKIGLLSGVVLLLSQSIYSILRLFPLFHMISQKNSEFVITFGQFLKTPLHWFIGNTPTLIRWETSYLTIPIVLLIVVGIVAAVLDRKKEVLVIIGSFTVPFIAMAAFNKVIYPRYLLTFTPLLFLIAAYGIQKFWHLKKISKNIKTIILTILFAIPAFVTFKIITTPIEAPIAEADNYQYLNSWSAGFGVVETRIFLSDQSRKSSSVTLLTEGTFGLMPYALDLYQSEYPNVHIKSLWPLPGSVPNEFEKDLKNNIPVYVLIYQRNALPENWNLRLVYSYKQGTSSDSLRVYQLLSK